MALHAVGTRLFNGCIFATGAVLLSQTLAGAVCAAAAAHPAAWAGQHILPEDCRRARVAGRWVWGVQAVGG